MTLALILAALLVVAGYFGWQWWQAQIKRAASKGLRQAAELAAALALSDPQDGGQLLWEAGGPRYYPDPESSEQSKALLQAWEVALTQQLDTRQGRPPPPTALPQHIDNLMPTMLPMANLGLYTPQPQTWAQLQRNLSALAATSLLMERRAGRWLDTHAAVHQELSAQLQQAATLEAVNVGAWRRRAGNGQMS